VLYSWPHPVPWVKQEEFATCRVWPHEGTRSGADLDWGWIALEANTLVWNSHLHEVFHLVNSKRIGFINLSAPLERQLVNEAKADSC
jgi:hypothetical protein